MKITFYIIALTTLLASCNQSTKGNWTAEDKEKIRVEMKVMEPVLTNLGIDYDEYVKCVVEKSEKNYSSFSEADADFKGCEDMAAECMEELMMDPESTAGNWSKQDLNRMKVAMDGIRAETDVQSEELEAFITCYSEKAIAKYDSYFDADTDVEGCQKLSSECLVELEIEF